LILSVAAGLVLSGAASPGVCGEAPPRQETTLAPAPADCYGCIFAQVLDRARQAKCLSNLKQIGLALFTYRQENDGKWPTDLDTLVEKRYLTDRQVLQCSAARSPYGSVDYALVRTEKREFAPPDVVVYDRKGNHADGRNVLLFDMQVIWLSEEDFKKRMGNELYG
jgi:hypothetical protein